MKKIIAFLLLAAMLLTLAACASEEDTPSTEETTTLPTQEADPSESVSDPDESTADAHEGHVHIAYRGVANRFDTEEMERIEGRPCDYTSDAGDTTLYIYNNVSFDGMNFTQLQYTFSDASTRVSCTYSVSGDLGEEERAAELAEVLKVDRAILDGLYGEGSESETSDGSVMISWRDVHGNYVLMMQLNSATLQVCYYLCAE